MKRKISILLAVFGLAFVISQCSAYGDTWKQNATATAENNTGAGTGGSAAPLVFYIYTEGITVSGNLGNRATSSSTCATVQAVNFASLTCTNHLAVVSYSGDDLANAGAGHSVPTARALTSTGGTEVAPDWNTFLNGTLSNTLDAAGVASTTPTPFYWSSSATGGTYNGTFNCSDNTDGSGGSLGAQGAVTTTAGTHLSFAVNQPCDGSTNSAYLMCLCWN